MIRLAAIAVALALALAGCGGDDEPAPATVVVAPESVPETSATSADDTDHADSSAGGAEPGAEDANGEADNGGATTAAPPPLFGEDGPTADDVDRVTEEQRERLKRIREAVAEARDDPEALLELREELRPTPAERRRFLRWYEQLCARPEAPADICD